MVTKKLLQKELTKLFNTFFLERSFVVDVKCLDFYNDYQPSRGDEVVTYQYKFHITIKDKVYTYEGWSYDGVELKQIALGIFSHWLLKNYKIYDGPSTAWYHSYTCYGNLVEKESE